MPCTDKGAEGDGTVTSHRKITIAQDCQTADPDRFRSALKKGSIVIDRCPCIRMDKGNKTIWGYECWWRIIPQEKEVKIDYG